VHHECEGLLCEVDEQERFASHLRRLLENRDEARRLGLAGRERAVQHFERHQVVARYETLYKQLVGRV
jgi:glycosyltransferase involved in cell wall biosynthesis